MQVTTTACAPIIIGAIAVAQHEGGTTVAHHDGNRKNASCVLWFAVDIVTNVAYCLINLCPSRSHFAAIPD
jgi:hypothetical protein